MQKLFGESLVIPPAYMYGATTRAVDRCQPDVEKIILPKKRYDSLSMNLSVDFSEAKFKSERTFFQRIIQNKSNRARPIDGLFCDFRVFSPENWAHIFFYHIPLACKLVDLYGEDIVFVLPELKNKKIFQLFELFNIKYIESNETFQGNQILFDVESFEICTLKRREWLNLRLPEAYSKLDSYHCALFPKKIFVNRRDSRKIINQDVRSFLISEGFQEIFMEDYDALTQIKILDNANIIVGIHGAGLAPLLLSRSESCGKKMVGIMPAVQVTSGFRLLCFQSGISWTGVRGKIESRFASHLLSTSPPPLAWSYQNFQVCVESLKRALKEPSEVA